MKTLNVLSSACRYCQYYKPEGRRGGMCQLLGVTVQGSWKACHMSTPAFAPSWEGLEGMIVLPLENSALAATESAEESRWAGGTRSPLWGTRGPHGVGIRG